MGGENRSQRTSVARSGLAPLSRSSRQRLIFFWVTAMNKHVLPVCGIVVAPDVGVVRKRTSVGADCNAYTSSYGVTACKRDARVSLPGSVRSVALGGRELCLQSTCIHWRRRSGAACSLPIGVPVHDGERRGWLGP